MRSFFTPGPAELLPGALNNIRNCFGRGDSEYLSLEHSVLSGIKSLVKHEHIVRLQGSASLAIEIAILNQIKGRTLVIKTGYYSDRIEQICKNSPYLSSVDYASLEDAYHLDCKYDWILACYVETSDGYKIDPNTLNDLKNKLSARLFLDATASIALETDHDIADICAFSSCKGLCGLTGASFITYNGNEDFNIVPSFYLNIQTHIRKGCTGPYHIIQSLYTSLSNLDSIRTSVSACKSYALERLSNHIVHPPKNQPMICTALKCKLKESEKYVLYAPRAIQRPAQSIICHLGETHLGYQAGGKILDDLLIEG